ncbi:hypothetical protein B0H13DRAFT_1881652 [Mycena leptocephala]|nr:hypothetical protein B0H13DRAFT_1881652 [Mycena leptocephala]
MWPSRQLPAIIFTRTRVARIKPVTRSLGRPVNYHPKVGSLSHKLRLMGQARILGIIGYNYWRKALHWLRVHTSLRPRGSCTSRRHSSNRALRASLLPVWLPHNAPTKEHTYAGTSPTSQRHMPGQDAAAQRRFPRRGGSGAAGPDGEQEGDG